MEIVKAVVLASDRHGPEAWPSLGLAARQLAPVANKPVLFHHLEALRAAGVRHAAVVIDETTGTEIRLAVGDGSPWGLEVVYLEGDGTLDVLASPAVADFAGGSPVLVQHGDVLVGDRLSALSDHFAENALDALILRPGTALEDALAPALPASTGYMIGADVQRAIRRDAERSHWAGLDPVLARLRKDGARIQVREVDACLPCRGTADALIDANRRMLEEMVPEGTAERIFGSQLQGRVAVHPSAEVRDSLVRGPVSIGPRARIANAYIGPYTSIGADVRIESVEIEHSIVLDRAQISYLGARVEGSLVGPDAVVTRDFRVPRAVRLSVGEGAEVAFS
jgi:glucose-1-phosphate thymidylyltransferase